MPGQEPAGGEGGIGGGLASTMFNATVNCPHRAPSLVPLFSFVGWFRTTGTNPEWRFRSWGGVGGPCWTSVEILFAVKLVNDSAILLYLLKHQLLPR